MPKTKNFIKIHHGSYKSMNSIRIPHSNRELYRVFKDIKVYNRAEFSYPDRPGIQRGVARTIGKRGKNLIDNGFLNPPTITHNRFPSLNVISVPTPKPPSNKKIVIKERKGNKYSWFDFSRR